MSQINVMGLSVIICCYNSATRLPETLKALAKQHCMEWLKWEVILIDNGSVDNTAGVAVDCWRSFNNHIPLRVVSEPKPGLSNARRRGVAEAIYAFLLFCDDDNWLCENYLQGVFDILYSDDRIAACGGMGIPVFESAEPFWFYEYAEAFALGSQEMLRENGRQLNLYGAGMGVRQCIIAALYDGGFSPLFNGREGYNLSSSEDSELTSIFVLQGYRLVFSDELKFHHFMSKERLDFSYLKRLFTAFGNDGPLRSLYYSYTSRRANHRMVKYWWFHFLLSMYRLAKYTVVPPKRFGRSVYFRWNLAYIKRLLMIKGDYAGYNAGIRAFAARGQFRLQGEEKTINEIQEVKAADL